MLFCDISYEVRQINRYVLVIAAVLVAFIILLFVVSRNTLKTLDTKDAEMKNFFANASHELKTPLMAIIPPGQRNDGTEYDTHRCTGDSL